MKIFIKRSLQLIFMAIFITMAVSSVCAQGWKKGAQKLPKALGKKPPLTGTASVVRPPVTPRVPSTVTGASIPTPVVTGVATSAHAIPSATLNAAVKRAALTRPQSIAKRINATDDHSFINALGFNHYVLDSWKEKEVLDWSKAFVRFITQDTHNFILLKNTTTSSRWQSVTSNLDPDGSTIREAIQKADDFFFIEHNGQLYIKKEAVEKAPLYALYLNQLRRKINSKILDSFFETDAVIDFIMYRDSQIMESLRENKGVSSLDEAKPHMGEVIERTDITTQRTAEEIQNLVKNLNSNNPLRQTIEEALEIVPTTNTTDFTHSKADATTQRTAEEISFLIGNLDINNSLRQTMEQALKSATEKGYINPIENSIQQ